MTAVKLEAIFKEQEQKLKLFKLKSDPVDASKTYVGYMLSEQPSTTDSIMGTGGRVLKTIGSTIKGLEQGARTFRQIGEGDLGQLEELGNALLAKLYDKMAGKAMLLGKKGYTRVNLNDETIVSTLNEYAKSKVTKESFLTRVNEGIFNFLKKKEPEVQKNIRPQPVSRINQQLELPLGVKRVPRLSPEKIRNRQEALRLFRNLPPKEKKELVLYLQGMQDMYDILKKPLNEQKVNPPKKILKLVKDDPEFVKRMISGELDVTPETDNGDQQFDESDLIFNIVNQKAFGKGTQFVLQAEDKALDEMLKQIGINQITIFRPEEKNQNTNTLDVYFYGPNNNAIPQLMFTGLRYAYDDSKKAYVVNSKIAAKKLPPVFKSSLPIETDSVDIISRDDANKIIKFNFKPTAFQTQTGLNAYKDRFMQPVTKKGMQGENYATISAPFMFSDDKTYYILDASKMSTSFDRNSKFYDQNQLKQLRGKGKAKSTSKPKPKPKTPAKVAPKTSTPKPETSTPKFKVSPPKSKQTEFKM